MENTRAGVPSSSIQFNLTVVVEILLAPLFNLDVITMRAETVASICTDDEMRRGAWRDVMIEMYVVVLVLI
jgi:hypothetical protein